MFSRVKNKLGGTFRRLEFNHRCKGILKTPPISMDKNSNLALISMVQSKDLIMYLLAVKSFRKHVPFSKVFFLNDGSLSETDREVLKYHLPRAEMLSLADFQSPHCPKGGCWERLLAISELVKDHYVIQLDCDTLSVGNILEIRECIDSACGFTLGTWDNQDVETMEERCGVAKSLKPNEQSHVQVLAEANFDKLVNYSTLKYIRGCAGFAGFPRKAFSKEFIEQFSKEMFQAIGERWNSWGSEQLMSNVVVANLEKNMVLPHPKYCAVHKADSRTSFIHFIGTYRFDGGIYAKFGAEIIDQLS